MRVAIVGSRDYKHLDNVRRFVAALPADTIVVSGGARGVDKTAEDAAVARGLSAEVFLPDYKRYGRYRAPKERNTEIVARCEVLVAFWTGSGGTRDAISKALQDGKPVNVVWDAPILGASVWAAHAASLPTSKSMAFWYEATPASI